MSDTYKAATVRTTIKRNDIGEYVVRLHINGIHNAEADYFTDNYRDALSTSIAMRAEWTEHDAEAKTYRYSVAIAHPVVPYYAHEVTADCSEAAVARVVAQYTELYGTAPRVLSVACIHPDTKLPPHDDPATAAADAVERWDAAD